MSKGRKTLERIDREIAGLRREEEKLTAEISRMAERIAALREKEIEAFRALAAFRLGQDGDAELGGRLDRAQAEIQRLRSARDSALANLAQEIELASAEIDALEADRDRLSRRITDLRAQVDAKDAELLERLKDDASYLERIAAVETAEKVAVEAERKAELAKDDRIEKGAPYEADPLFMYLWKRGYGTSDYGGRGLARMLDAWVARLVRYHGARPNYHMLLELPERLGEHAVRSREAADDEARRLVAFESEKRGEAGILGLDENVDADEAELAKVAERLNEQIGVRTALETKRAAVNRGEDEASRSAIDTIVGALQDTSLKQLHRAALLTPDPTDERLVETIDDLRDDIEDLEHDLDRRRKVERDLENKLGELQEVRGRFVGERYDDDRWEFDDDMVEDFLKELLRGVISGAAVWAEMRRRGKYSDGPSRPGPWGRAPGGGSIFKPRRSGSSGGFGRGGFGRGGFRTGGGFRGGGGFRTGGKF
ncbi:hypothetical protein [Microbaculum sp. FT89]|uniref:hypothetical protein n=1 Tax=Microbaculum sp. FT89 TaxID=3447298 RepID=UPI003F535A27